MLTSILLLLSLAAQAAPKPCFVRGVDGYWRKAPLDAEGNCPGVPREKVDALVPRDAYDLAAPSILKIEIPADAAGRPQRAGTAVCVGDRMAATAAHVVNRPGKFRVVFERSDGEPNIYTDWMRAEGSHIAHKQYDIALVIAPPCHAVQIAPVPAIGEAVFTVGYPYPDWARHARWGRIGSRPAGRWVMTDLATDHGDSGSGLFNERGELVAICQGKSAVGAPFIDAALIPALIEEAIALRKMKRFQ